LPSEGLVLLRERCEKISPLDWEGEVTVPPSVQAMEGGPLTQRAWRRQDSRGWPPRMSPEAVMPATLSFCKKAPWGCWSDSSGRALPSKWEPLSSNPSATKK
jgi:hypothetical protein